MQSGKLFYVIYHILVLVKSNTSIDKMLYLYWLIHILVLAKSYIGIDEIIYIPRKRVGDGTFLDKFEGEIEETELRFKYLIDRIIG